MWLVISNECEENYNNAPPNRKFSILKIFHILHKQILILKIKLKVHYVAFFKQYALLILTPT